jgi:AraC-like DNA-binding protein
MGFWEKAPSNQGGENLTNLTLEDIAKRCGVSRSTVSRVINNHPREALPGGCSKRKNVDVWLENRRR